MRTKILILAGMWAILITASSAASKSVGNRAYVQSGPDGVFYARCVPADATGDQGVTTIYRVEAKKDVEVDRYDWFSRQGLVLGWSPIAGQVAVLRKGAPKSEDPEKQVEFSFYLGGKLLKAWTTQELVDLGARVGAHKLNFEKRAYLQYLGCEQIPGSNHYVFEVKLLPDKVLRFDILTGKLRQEKK